MFTKEVLLEMKYKELVTLAKQHGVYKSRSKKVYLLHQLLSLLNDELVMKEQPSTQESIMKETEVAASNEEMLIAELTPFRRDTFEIDPRTKTDTFKAAEKPYSNDEGNNLEINLPLNRRETYSIEKEEKSPYKESGRTPICKQKTSSINKPKENLAPDKISRTPVLRQNTFSIDKPGKYHKLEEMPGVICQESKCNPTIKPYIVKETPPRSIGFRSPIITRNSLLPSSVGPIRSIGQRIEHKRSTKSEKRPSSRGSKQPKNLSLNMVSVTPSRIHKTSMKGGKIEKKITPSKLPNFKAIHMREFSKMESIVEHTNRKAERTKNLLTPIKFNHQIQTSSVEKTTISRIPLKFDLKVNVTKAKFTSVNPSKPANKTPSRGKQSIIPPNPKLNLSLRKSSVSKVKDKLKFLDSPMTKVRRKSASQVKDTPNKIVCNPKMRVENIKEIVTTKIHPFSVERNRVKGRDFLQSVRMNRRFQLQMEVMRKAKV